MSITIICLSLQMIIHQRYLANKGTTMYVGGRFELAFVNTFDDIIKYTEKGLT